MACDPGWVPADPYRGHRFPEVIISQCVWLYFNFCLSLRDLELMMTASGVQLSYEAIRRLVRQVRPVLCSQTEAEAAPDRRQMAFGGSVPQD